MTDQNAFFTGPVTGFDVGDQFLLQKGDEFFAPSTVFHGGLSLYAYRWGGRKVACAIGITDTHHDHFPGKRARGPRFRKLHTKTK